MIQWVHERAARARSLDALLVATDDERIRSCVEGFGGVAVLTSPDHPTGTDRLAEAAADLECDVVVNVQGDEPLIAPEAIDLAVTALAADDAADAATLATPLTEPADFLSPSVVKVVVDERGHALYFSRSPIPHVADPAGDGVPEGALRHLGLYAYRREFLLRFCSWPPAPLERVERLEQLRALHHGAVVRVATTPHAGPAVDEPADVARVEDLLAAATGPDPDPATPPTTGER